MTDEHLSLLLKFVVSIILILICIHDLYDFKRKSFKLSGIKLYIWISLLLISFTLFLSTAIQFI